MGKTYEKLCTTVFVQMPRILSLTWVCHTRNQRIDVEQKKQHFFLLWQNIFPQQPCDSSLDVCSVVRKNHLKRMRQENIPGVLKGNKTVGVWKLVLGPTLTFPAKTRSCLNSTKRCALAIDWWDLTEIGSTLCRCQKLPLLTQLAVLFQLLSSTLPRTVTKIFRVQFYRI